jgi:hypothetical protein
VRAGSPAATLRRVGVIQPPLASKRKDLPPELCAALDRTLLPSPEDRGELVDLADALAEALPEVSDDGGTVAPHPLEDAYELPSWTARAAAAAGAGLLGGARGRRACCRTPRSRPRPPRPAPPSSSRSCRAPAGSSPPPRR